MEKKNKNILLTGGHATATAYALIQYIKPREEDWNFYWVGPESHIEGEKVESLENKEFKRLGVKIRTLDTGRVQRKFTLWTIPALLKIPWGLINALAILKKIKPDLVLSFGGFVGFPVALAAKILDVPLVIHEQTAAAGRGNIAASKFADRIAISRPSSSRYFPVKKTVLTGNPVDPKILEIKPKDIINTTPMLFVTGGHTGSKTLNENIFEILKKVLESFDVVHQTGKLDFDKFLLARKSLAPKLQKRYKVYETIPPQKWPSFLAKSDVILSRAGANFVSQLMVVKRPAVLVPIPFSYLNEQYENAKYAKEFGIAQIVEEKDLTPLYLLKKLLLLKKNWKRFVTQTREKKSPDVNSSQRLYFLIKSLT